MAAVRASTSKALVVEAGQVRRIDPCPETSPLAGIPVHEHLLQKKTTVGAKWKKSVVSSRSH